MWIISFLYDFAINILYSITNIVNNSFVKEIYEYVYKIQKEPTTFEWISISSHEFNNYKERYYDMEDDITDIIKDSLVLVIKKKGELYEIRETGLNNKTICEYIPNLKTSFIHIEYKYAGLKTPINIHLGKNMFIVGNEILSYTFVMRYLAYNYGNSHEFDMNYTLTLIDNDVNIINLNKYQYILINEFDYEVKEISYIMNNKMI